MQWELFITFVAGGLLCTLAFLIGWGIRRRQRRAYTHCLFLAEMDDITVSTVIVDGPRIPAEERFETCIIGGPLNGTLMFYPTADAAKRGHQHAIAQVKSLAEQSRVDARSKVTVALADFRKLFAVNLRKDADS